MISSRLVQFGRSGFVGRFTAPVPYERGARVIVRGPRGVEPGLVLCEPGEPFAPALPVEGDIPRAATPDDDDRLAHFPAREAALLAAAAAAAADRRLPLAFVDAELTLDDRLILHGLAWAACDATALFEHLSARFGLAVRLLDLSRTAVAPDAPPPAAAGCSTCGTGGGCSSCGSGAAGGGCSSGSCSRGGVKSADELSAYFADLRRRMEADRTPLH